MEIIIQKFGGTSVATEESRKIVAQKIINAKNSGKYPVVIVSAIGRRGEPYATDTLIDFSNSVYHEIASRELDLIMSCGEIISSVIMSNTIKSLGYKAVALTGYQAGIITDETFGDAEVLDVDPQNIINYLKQDYIVVVTGFQGITQKNDITTLGRGGSDTTAVVIGDALKCKLVEIYTDVDGVMTADPRIVPDAKTLDFLTFGEIYQMAKDGARVIHSKAIDIAVKKNISLNIKNTFTESKGTIINSNQNIDFDRVNSKNPVTAIAHKNGMSQVIFNIDFDNKSELLKEFEKNKIDINMISFFKHEVQIVIDKINLDLLFQMIKNLGIKDYNVSNNLSKLTLIGKQVNNIPNLIYKISETLKQNKIEILQLAEFDNNLSLLIKERELISAANIIHQKFILT